MGEILYGKQLKKFISKYKIECTSIILKIDDTNKTASYIIDGTKEITADYEQLKNYF